MTWYFKYSTVTDGYSAFDLNISDFLSNFHIQYSSRSELECPPIDTTWIETTSKKAALKVIYNNIILSTCFRNILKDNLKWKLLSLLICDLQKLLAFDGRPALWLFFFCKIWEELLAPATPHF